MQAKVAVVCDSSVCLPWEVVSEYGIHIAPMELSISGKRYQDGVDISTREFYSLLAQKSGPPTTSAPTVASFLETYTRGATRAESVLCLTLLSTVSATYNAAVQAAEMARDRLPNTRIEVVDTHTAAGGHGLVALAAARRASQNADLREVTMEAQRVMQRVNLIAFLDTLQYLSRSGRIPRIAAWAGSALQLKPMMELSQGGIRPLGRPRTRQRAMDQLLSIIRERAGGDPIRVNVMHALAEEDALYIKERLLAEFKCVEALVSEFTPVMGAHTGPGLLGIAFYKEGGS